MLATSVLVGRSFVGLVREGRTSQPGPLPGTA
jgi:hypothetical protein